MVGCGSDSGGGGGVCAGCSSSLFTFDLTMSALLANVVLNSDESSVSAPLVALLIGIDVVAGGGGGDGVVVDVVAVSVGVSSSHASAWHELHKYFSRLRILAKPTHAM